MSEQLSTFIAQGLELLPTFFQKWETPRAFVQCGAGFDPSRLFSGTPEAIELNRLPGMPQQVTPDNEHPKLLFGHSGTVPILATQGHRHLYEGNGANPCILPLCIAHAAGAHTVILVDSGLSLRQEIKPGSWMVLTDFINAHAVSPLDGNHDLLPEAFPDMTNALSQPLNSELVNTLDTLGITPRLGIYLSRPGSQFCTVSEANLARANGADMVGHDFVMEIITAHALKCNVSALALASMNAPDYYASPLKRQELLETCQFCSGEMMRAIRRTLKTWE